MLLPIDGSVFRDMVTDGHDRLVNLGINDYCLCSYKDSLTCPVWESKMKAIDLLADWFLLNMYDARLLYNAIAVTDMAMIAMADHIMKDDECDLVEFGLN